jgi:mono/diheme cytochrome c family protein
MPPAPTCENTAVISHGKYFAFPALFLLASVTLVHASDTKSAELAGAVLFRDKGCTYCHGANLEGTKKAPSLTDLRKQKEWTNEKITSQILDGGQKMPPFRESVSDDEIQQLIAFLRAKNRPTPPAAPQQ